MTMHRLKPACLLLALLLIRTNCPGQENTYSYVSRGTRISAIASHEKFVVKFAPDVPLDETISRVTGAGFVAIDTNWCDPNRSLMAVKSNTNSSSSLTILRSIPGVVFAMPFFIGSNQSEFTAANRLVVVLKPGVHIGALQSLNESFGLEVHFRDPNTIGRERAILTSPWD